MLSEIKALFGNRIFFVVIGIGAAIFVWREFFASAAAPSSARNVIEQGRNAEQREKGIGDDAEARACSARIKAAIESIPVAEIPASVFSCDPSYLKKDAPSALSATTAQWFSRPQIEEVTPSTQCLNRFSVFSRAAPAGYAEFKTYTSMQTNPYLKKLIGDCADILAPDDAKKVRLMLATMTPQGNAR
jgi:hypothetical protein